jgi:hypothetical protein
MLGTFHQGVSEVRLVDCDQTRMEAQGILREAREEEEEKRGVVVMSRCGHPYLASPSLLCGIRCMLGSLVDDAGHLANHFG